MALPSWLVGLRRHSLSLTHKPQKTIHLNKVLQLHYIWILHALWFCKTKQCETWRTNPPIHLVPYTYTYWGGFLVLTPNLLLVGGIHEVNVQIPNRNAGRKWQVNSQRDMYPKTKLFKLNCICKLDSQMSTHIQLLKKNCQSNPFRHHWFFRE